MGYGAVYVVGVPKHSYFEPDYFLAKGNRKLPQIAVGTLRFAAGNRELNSTDHPIIEWNHEN